jgi:predicted DCC family thiol-disulfide oxidoreductase YuxK
MITIFYDDKCNVCSREINFYRKHALRGSFKWLGIGSSAKELSFENIKIVDALMYLHAKDCEGSLHVGVDAFILIWSQLSYFKYLSYFISLPFIYQLTAFFYAKFAKYRFNNLDHCQVAFKKAK